MKKNTEKRNTRKSGKSNEIQGELHEVPDRKIEMGQWLTWK